MINIYRRHAKEKCGSYPTRTEYKHDKCNCPFWADGAPLREARSLKTRDVREARQRLARLEATNGETFEELQATAAAAKTLAEATAVFLDDPDFKQANSTDTVRKFKTLFAQLGEYLTRRRVATIDGINADMVADFRNWLMTPRPDNRFKKERRMTKDGVRACNNKTRQLKQFFSMAVTRGWIEKDPIDKLKLSEVRTESKQGLSSDTMEKILAQAAADIRDPRANHTSLATALRVEAIILLQRYSGVRISDAVSCRIDAIKNGRLILTAQKNKKQICNELPEFVLDKLAAVPAVNKIYFFWTGFGDSPKHCANMYRGAMQALFQRAGVTGISTHSFRHTFARAILAQPGKTLQDVADALGDNLTTVQKHYAGKSEERTARTNEAIRSTWANDPILQRMQVEKYGSKKVVGIASRRVK